MIILICNNNGSIILVMHPPHWVQASTGVALLELKCKSKKVKSLMKMVGSSEALALSRMELSIQANGLTVLEMDTAHKCGLMDQDMKEAGRMIRPMDKVNWSMLTVMFMKVCG